MLVASIGDSVDRAFDTFFAWLPSLVGALVILVIGYIVAKVVSNLLARVLRRAGLDREMLQGRVGTWVGKVTSSPSGLIGAIAFWAILLGAISLAATALGIDALTAFISSVYAYIPNVIAALLIFLVASAVAAGIAALVTRTMGDTPTGKVLATVAPGIVMAIAVFMILQQLHIAETIVVITYASLLGSFALAAALAFGLGGRDVAARMLEGAYVKGQQSTEQMRRDLAVGRERAQHDIQRAKNAAQEQESGQQQQQPVGAPTGNQVPPSDPPTERYEP
jgi:hypothetical protein